MQRLATEISPEYPVFSRPEFLPSKLVLSLLANGALGSSDPPQSPGLGVTEGSLQSLHKTVLVLCLIRADLGSQLLRKLRQGEQTFEICLSYIAVWG